VPSALTRATDRSVVALGEGPPLVLRETGLAVWTAFARPGTVPEVVAELATAYGCAPDALDADVAAFVRRLVAAGLLEPDA
jgi:hypothetical protein